MKSRNDITRNRILKTGVMISEVRLLVTFFKKGFHKRSFDRSIIGTWGISEVCVFWKCNKNAVLKWAIPKWHILIVKVSGIAILEVQLNLTYDIVSSKMQSSLNIKEMYREARLQRPYFRNSFLIELTRWRGDGNEWFSI